jgi:hypothetical protein
LNKLVIIMKIWPKYFRFDYSSGVQFKSLEEFLNVEYVVFEEMKNSFHVSICFKRINWIMVIVEIDEQYKK